MFKDPQKIAYALFQNHLKGFLSFVSQMNDYSQKYAQNDGKNTDESSAMLVYAVDNLINQSTLVLQNIEKVAPEQAKQKTIFWQAMDALRVRVIKFKNDLMSYRTQIDLKDKSKKASQNVKRIWQKLGENLQDFTRFCKAAVQSIAKASQQVISGSPTKQAHMNSEDREKNTQISCPTPLRVVSPKSALNAAKSMGFDEIPTTAMLKTKYKTLAAKLHPDKNIKDLQATDKFNKLGINKQIIDDYLNNTPDVVANNVKVRAAFATLKIDFITNVADIDRAVAKTKSGFLPSFLVSSEVKNAKETLMGFLVEKGVHDPKLKNFIKKQNVEQSKNTY